MADRFVISAHIRSPCSCSRSPLVLAVVTQPVKSRPGSIPPQHGLGFRQIVIPASSTQNLPDLCSPARYKDGGSTAADGFAKGATDCHTLYGFPFTLQQLMLFRSLCVAGSLEGASRAVDVSTNHLQTVLGRLEKELNIGLVSQKGRGKPIQPTAAGTLLLRYTERMLSLASDSVAAANDLQEVRMGTMYVGASQTTGVYMMPKLIAEYKRDHPAVTVHLQVENTRRCCLAVSRGEVDIAIVGGTIPRDLSHLLQVTPLQNDEVVLVVAKDHPYAAAEQIGKDQLSALKYVALHRSSTVQAIHETLEQNGVNWRALPVVMEVNSIEAIKNAVEANLGAAFVSRAAIEKEVELGRLSILTIKDLPLSRPLLCITDPGRYCSLAVRAFIRALFGLTVVTVPDGCIARLLDDGEQGQSSSVANGSTRYPSLRGRAPHVHELSGTAFDDPDQPASHQECSGAGPGHSGGLSPPDRVPFTLAQVAVFCLVARTGNFKACALALSISQPAVSKSLAGFERAMGIALLSRGRHGPSMLTDAGQVVLSYCESLLAVANEAWRMLSDFRTANAGVVSIGASQTVATYLLPQLIAGFRMHNPQVTVQMQVDRSRKVCEAVARGESDVAVVGGEVPTELCDVLQVVPYAQDELVLVVPRGHPLAGQTAIDKDELYNLTFVTLNQGSTAQQAQEQALHQHGITWRTLNIDMEFNSVEAIKGAVQHGLGAAFISASAIKKELQLGLLCRVPIHGVRLARTLSLIYCPKRPHSAAARKFLGDVFCVVPGEDGVLKSATPVMPFRPASGPPRPWEKKHAGEDERAPVPVVNGSAVGPSGLPDMDAAAEQSRMNAEGNGNGNGNGNGHVNGNGVGRYNGYGNGSLSNGAGSDGLGDNGLNGSNGIARGPQHRKEDSIR